MSTRWTDRGRRHGKPARHDSGDRHMTRPTTVALAVNGIPRSVEVPPGWRLLDLLRDGLGLVGTKEGCDDGTCGTCVVMVDGRAVRACRTPANGVAGRDVVTIEGLGSAEHPHALQEAFAAADATQCGFCTPGMIMAAAALLERNPRPSRSEIVRWLGSNLCRCTGYHSIVDAIEWVAGGRQGPPRRWPSAELPPPGARPTEATGPRRTDALEKATGRALYAADLAVEGMLHARVLRSPHPHADIVRIDAERARELPGVQAILTARDVPGENSYGRKLKDQPVLAVARVRQVGDPVALVVAASPGAAAAALSAIEVEYRPLPAVSSPDDALADGAPAIHPDGNLLAEHWLRSGDIAEGFARADVVVEDVYTTPWNEHAYLEPEAALAAWDSDTLVVRTATQYSHYHRAEIARTLGLPSERVRVIPTVVGGAFGGKTDISCQCLAALAAFDQFPPDRIVTLKEEVAGQPLVEEQIVGARRRAFCQTLAQSWRQVVDQPSQHREIGIDRVEIVLGVPHRGGALEAATQDGALQGEPLRLKGVGIGQAGEGGHRLALALADQLAGHPDSRAAPSPRAPVYTCCTPSAGIVHDQG